MTVTWNTINPDTQIFAAALRAWNIEKTGSEDPCKHIPAWRLTAGEWSEVAQRAERMKREANVAGIETDPPRGH